MRLVACAVLCLHLAACVVSEPPAPDHDGTIHVEQLTPKEALALLEDTAEAAAAWDLLDSKDICVLACSAVAALGCGAVVTACYGVSAITIGATVIPCGFACGAACGAASAGVAGCVHLCT